MRIASTITYIRRHISSLPKNVIFTTRDLLSYGSRASVDQALYRLVKQRAIIRLARGVFIRDGSKIPKIADVASAKAQAFGKQIGMHGYELLRKLFPDSQEPVQDTSQIVATFAVNSRTSSFRFGSVTILLHGVCQRKMQLAKSNVGCVVLALWAGGKTLCSQGLLQKLTRFWARKELQLIKQMASIIPAWLAQYWVNCNQRYVPALSLQRMTFSKMNR